MKGQYSRFLSNHGKLHLAEIYLLVALVLCGGIACFLLPVSGGYDEEQHLLRVWEMSDYTFLPNQGLRNNMPFPRLYVMLSYRREPIVRAVAPDFWDNYASLSLDSKGFVDNLDTRSVYSPPLLLPQALVMRFLGRSQILSALSVYYASRLAGLLSYTFLAFLAIRLVPYGKWTMAILATSPVMILQSATITPDIISNGIALFFIGGCLYIAFRREFGRSELITTLVLIFVLFWGKINIIPLVLLPFLLIPPSRFTVRNGYVILLVGTFIFFLIEVAGWNMVGYSRYYDALPGANAVGQVRFILAEPFQFIKVIVRDIWLQWPGYLRHSIAIYGLNYWPVPVWTFYLYGAGILATLLITQDQTIPDQGRFRTSLLITFLAAYVWTIVSLYISYTPVASDMVLGVQGRYFAGVMPLFFLAVSGLSLGQQKIRLPVYVPFVLGGFSLILYVAGMYLSYHVNCGSQYYAGGLCYQPNYKNWSPDELYSAPISDDLSLKQKLTAECGGMSEFRVWIDSSGSDPDGATLFSLVNLTTNRTIISQTISNPDIPEKEWLTLSFPPEWESLGNVYQFNIQTSSGEQGPKLAYSLKPEYLRGRLFENDIPVDLDILFQMGCMAGWDSVRQDPE